MPFIDAQFLPSKVDTLQRLLITSADDSDVIKTSFKLAQFFHKKGDSVLWIDGNLGERLPEQMPQNESLKEILSGKKPLTLGIKKFQDISILTGISDFFLSELSTKKQYQFLQDLRLIYPNFDRIIFAVDGKNPILQQKWMQETEGIYLLFSTKNLLMNRTLTWLKENASLTKGLVGIGKNDQEVLLTYMRLKEVLNTVPDLILDIKEIAP